MPGYSLPTKSYPVLNGKKMFFLCKCYNRILNKTGLRRLNWVVSHLSTKIICNKTGCLAINLYRKLTTYAKDLTFSRICRRLVNVRDDVIPFC